MNSGREDRNGDKVPPDQSLEEEDAPDDKESRAMEEDEFVS